MSKKLKEKNLSQILITLIDKLAKHFKNIKAQIIKIHNGLIK